MKKGMIGDKQMSLMPKWAENIMNIIFVVFVFAIVFGIIWVGYVLIRVYE